MYAPDSPDGRSAKEIWEIARSHLRLQLPQSTYDTWVRDTACLAHEDGAFVIGVNNAYAREWLQLRLRRLIKQTLVSIVGHAVDVTFIVQTTPIPDRPDPTPAPLLEVEQAQRQGRGAIAGCTPSERCSRPIGSAGGRPPGQKASV